MRNGAGVDAPSRPLSSDFGPGVVAASDSTDAVRPLRPLLCFRDERSIRHGQHRMGVPAALRPLSRIRSDADHRDWRQEEDGAARSAIAAAARQNDPSRDGARRGNLNRTRGLTARASIWTIGSADALGRAEEACWRGKSDGANLSVAPAASRTRGRGVLYTPPQCNLGLSYRGRVEWRLGGNSAACRSCLAGNLVRRPYFRRQA